MRKALFVVALLVATIALSATSKIGVTPAPFPSPLVVAKGKVLNQNAPISTTTIFTPTQSGLYRLSLYGTITQPNTISNAFWDVNVGWTDDYAPNLLRGFYFTENGDATAQPFFWNAEGFSGAPVMLQAKAGTPITYAVTQTGTIGNGQYSLYYTLERLE